MKRNLVHSAREEQHETTRPQIKELKDQLRKDSESVLTVGRGEVVTVRYENSYNFIYSK